MKIYKAEEKMGSKYDYGLENRSGCSDGGTIKKRRRRNNKRKAKILHSCSDCGFQSKRQFNVLRHYKRIHEPMKRPTTCCGEKYSTKGQFYQHCADAHPESNRASLVSETKYKITAGSSASPIMEKKDNTTRRRSLRNLKPKIEVKKEDDDDCFDTDTPLINYVKTPRLRRTIKKEKKFVESLKEEKKEVEGKQDREIADRQKLDDTSVHIFFKGDITSRYHDEIQREFLRDITFENF